MSQGASQRGWLLLAVCATLPLMIACVAERHLATDGVLFLRNTLDTDGFFFPAPTRVVAHFWLQAPLVLARWVGCDHLPTLVAFFGLGVLLPCWLGLAAAWWVLPPARRHFIALPIVSLLVFHYPLDGGMMHEGRVMDAALWPVLFLLLRREPWNRRDLLVLGVSLTTLMWSYEAVAGPGCLLAVLAWRRGKEADSPAQRRWAKGAAGLAALAVVIGVWGIVCPVDAGNRADFVDSLLEPWRWPLQWSGAVGVGVFLGAWASGHGAAMRWLGGLALVAAVVWGMGKFVPSRGWVYPVRTLSLTLVPGLVVIGCWLWHREKTMPAGGLAAAFSLWLALGAVLMVRLEAWREFRTQVRTAVSSRHGLVPVADIGLTRTRGRPEMNLPESRLIWDSWNLPLLSIVWSWPRVQAIILNPPGTPWEPFDPRRERPLAGVISYDPGLAPPPRDGPP